MKIKRYILILTILLTGILAKAQPPASWHYTPTGKYQQLFIPNGVVSLNGSSMTFGDAVGVFNEIGCVGYLMYPDTILTIYQKDTLLGVNGLTAGDSLKFRIWKKAEQCASRRFNVTITEGPQVFTPDSSSVLGGLFGSPSIVGYPPSGCTNSPDMEPYKMYMENFDYLTYTANSTEIVIDSISGIVGLENSVPGTFTIKAHTDVCLLEDTFSVTINPAPVSSFSTKSIIEECVPATLTISGADSVAWNTGNISSSITVDHSSVVSVIAKTNEGCIYRDTIKVNISKINIDSLRFEVNNDQVIVDTASIRFGLAPYKYYLNTPLASIETNDGDFKELENGEYMLKVKDRIGCAQSLMSLIEIQSLDLSNLYLDITHADCDDESKIIIDELSIVNGSPPYTYQFKSGVQSITFTTPVINNIPIGLYTLIITDSNNKTKTYSKLIEVNRNPCSKGVLVFGSAAMTGFDDPGFYVSYSGKVRVFDRNGMLIKEFTAPGNWDGTDLSGELVQMGDYVIVHENERPLSVTVIR